MVNLKTAGPDEINVNIVEHRMLHFLNKCWNPEKDPYQWESAVVFFSDI